MHGAPLLEMEGVSKRYGGVQALDDVSVTVRAGTIHGVIGSNGAGKTTLLSLICGAQAATAGEIRFRGTRLNGLGAPRVASLGIARAHQVPKPFRQMTVRQHLDVAARATKRSRAQRHHVIDTTLERCGLTAQADRLAGSLGLLDLKRLGVARALSTGASLLLLDEIAAGLTGNDIDTVVRLVLGVRDEDVTIVMVEHIQGLIRQLADRVTVLEWGRVLREGTPEEVASDPTVIQAYLGNAEDRPEIRPARGTARPAPVLRLDGVAVSYGALPALRDCTMTVGEGEVVGVVGANGAGKSTLARAVAGLVRAQSGAITLDGADITSARPHQRARQGLVMCPEGRRLFAEMTVEDNLRVAARRARGMTARGLDAAVSEALAVFPEIEPFRATPAGRLSGGQQQMVAICRALVANPRLVIFDELSLGLAPRLTSRIIQAVPDIAAQGVAVLLIEQNVSQALSVCDHVYVLERSRITFDGSPQELANEETLRAVYFGERQTEHG